MAPSEAARPAPAATGNRPRRVDQLGGVIGPDATTSKPSIQGSAVYSASPIKRFRRTKAAITSIRDAIRKVLEDHPQTVRQVFYALTVRGVIAKGEIEYHRTVIRLLGEMREAGKSRSSGSPTTPDG